MLEEQRGASAAEELLEDLGFDTLPIAPKDIAASIDCEQFRVVLEEQKFNSEGILGKAVGNEKGALIYVNSNIPDKRRLNFTAAHEIGHVCMHIMENKKMLFECGSKELNNPFNDPIEKEANGFASGLLMPKRLISKNFNGDITWYNIHYLSKLCNASLEATYRRISHLDKSPTALIIHKNGDFRRFVSSPNFDFYIERSPLSQGYPTDFESMDASYWINPRSNGITLKSIHASTVILDEGYSYTILSYDDDCLAEDSDYFVHETK